MNRIPELQNAAAQMSMMRARAQTYRDAEWLLRLQLFLTVALPVVTGVMTSFFPAIHNISVALSLLVSVVDVTWLDRLERQRLKLAAKICEEFDVAVLGLTWNKFAAGRRPDPEAIAGAAARWRGDDRGLKNWYPATVGMAPLHLARIICQRTNLWYDAELRRYYGGWVLAVAAALLLLLIGVAWARAATIELFIAAGLAPAAPILIWSLREVFRQRDTAEAQDATKADAEALWERAKTGECDDAECLRLSREFQNSIYARRVSSPLMLPLIYRTRRAKMESQMNQGADAYLAETGIAASDPTGPTT